MESETPGPTPLNSSEKELLREFLQGAPQELSKWVAAQEQLLAEDRGNKDDRLPTLVAAVSDQDNAGEESEDFYNDMEGDDDVLQRRNSRPRTPASAPVNPGRTALSGGAKLAIAVALFMGAGFGVWYAGREPAPETNTGTPTMTTGSSENADPLRQLDLEQQVAEDPSDVDAQLELGVLYFNQGQVTLAAKHWGVVTELEPDNITAWYNLGFARLSQDPPNMEGAQEAWQKVVDIDPESELAQTVIMHLDSFGTTGEQSGGK